MDGYTRNFFNVLSLIVLLFVTVNTSDPSSKPGSVYNDAKQQFGKLLTTIANMNEKRLKALKEYTDLDSIKAAGAFLRHVNKKNEKMAVLSEDATKALIYDTLYDVICKGGISPELSKYKDVMFRARNKGANEIEQLNDENMKGVINEILREMICKKNSKAGKKKNGSGRVSNSHHHHHHSDEHEEPHRYYRNKYELDRKEINKINALKKYIQSDKYKGGNALYKENEDKDNDDHLDEIILVNDGKTKSLITDVLREMICKDGETPGLSNYKDVILRAGNNNNRNVLPLNDENSKYVINEVLREMICATNNKRVIPKRRPSAAAWLRHTEHILSGHHDEHADTHHLNFNVENDATNTSNSQHSEIFDRKESNSPDNDRNDESILDIISYNGDDRNDSDGDGYNSDHSNNNDNDRNDEDKIYDDRNNANADDRVDADYNEKSDSGFDDENDKNKIPGNSENLNDDIIKEALRSSSSCWYEAKKSCKKACKHSVSEICEDYGCSSYFKSSFKDKCNENCEEMFD